VLSLADAGINLFSEQFNQDRAEVIQRAREAGVRQLLLISSDVAEANLNLQACHDFAGLVTTAGVHPHQAARVSDDWSNQLTELLALPQVVAVGECGLDFHRDFSPRPQQIAVFEQQLELAEQTNKAVYLHERDAFDTQISLLKNCVQLQGVAHCFTGNTSQLKAYLDLGLYVGITGWLCDERRNQDLVEALQYLPLDRLLLETDAPYLLPRTLPNKPKNRRNESAFLVEVAAQVARLKQCSVGEVIRQSSNNFNQLFGIQEPAHDVA